MGESNVVILDESLCEMTNYLNYKSKNVIILNCVIVLKLDYKNIVTKLSGLILKLSYNK